MFPLPPDEILGRLSNGKVALRMPLALLVQRLLMDVFRGVHRRTLGQVRGTNGGASSFPFVIDNGCG